MDPSLPFFSIDPSPPPIIPVVANPPTTVPSLPQNSNHPPYVNMICEAIGALKEKNGSSKRAISKYIESAFHNLPSTHPALLTHNLKTLKNNGILVMVKKSYKLASTARSEASVPDSSVPNLPDASPGTKRGRGRPPKPKSAVPAADPSSQQQSVPLADGAKETPGRPINNGLVGQIGASRGRGRPPKSGPKKSPGRLRKPKTVRSVVGGNAMKRGRGRPPKTLNQLPPQAVLPMQGQPMAVPYADTVAAAASTTTVAVPNLPRPRGRPKGTSGVTGVVVPGKRRGRPPKIGGVTSKPIKPKKTGKPVGRPKKNKATNGAESVALAAAYGDLKRKVEFFQAKVKQAVGVLKPQFSSESNINVFVAIQELEGLAAMDISTLFKEDAQLPQQPPPPPPPTTQPLVPQYEGQMH